MVLLFLGETEHAGSIEVDKRLVQQDTWRNEVEDTAVLTFLWPQDRWRSDEGGAEERSKSFLGGRMGNG